MVLMSLENRPNLSSLMTLPLQAPLSRRDLLSIKCPNRG